MYLEACFDWYKNTLVIKKITLNSQMFLTLLNNIIPVSYDIGVQFVAFKQYHQFVEDGQYLEEVF